MKNKKQKKYGGDTESDLKELAEFIDSNEEYIASLMPTLELKEPIANPVKSVLTILHDWSSKVYNNIEKNDINQVRPSENIQFFLSNRQVLLRIKLLKIFKDSEKLRLFIEALFILIIESKPFKAVIARNQENHPFDRMTNRPAATARRSAKSASTSSSPKKNV
jgi:hypothetical protein